MGNKSSSLNDQPTFPNVFKLEMTPAKPVMNPDNPLTVTLKSMATKRQEVIIELESLLFQILKPRAMEWHKSQVYCILAPGETMSFQIGVTKEKECWTNLYVKKKMSPEGLLKISHQTTDKEGDTDEDWGFMEDEGVPYIVPRGERVVPIYKDKSVEHGYFEMEMSYVGETEVIKERKEQFNAAKKHIEEEEKKRKEEEEKKKKKKCCLIL